MLFLRRSLVGILLMALSIAALAWAGNSVWTAVETAMSEEPRRRPNREVVLSVNAVAIEPGLATPDMEVFGEVLSARTLDIRANAAGTLIELSDKFQNGGAVSAGEVLGLIDPAQARSDLSMAEADLRDAEADLRDAHVGVDLAQDDLSVAQEQAELRANALTRQNDLLARGVGSASAMETAALAAAAARQSVVSRRQAQAQAVARVDQATTHLARMQIALEDAERLLSETKIIAGFDGTLSDVAITDGGLVARNEILGRLVDPQTLEVAFRLSTVQYARLQDENGRLNEAEVEVILDVAGMGLKTSGQIERESAVVGEGQTGRLIFAKMDRAIAFRPGDIVTVRINEPPLDDVARLPALSLGADNTVLVIDEDQRLVAEEVELVRRQGDTVLIKAPHLAGQVIVAERTPLLGAGIRVRPLNEIGDQVATGGPGGAAVPPPEAVNLALTEERRAALVAFVEENRRMPDEAKKRILGQLNQPEVPTDLVNRLESRMGS